LGLIGISGSSTFRHGPVRPSSSAFSPTIADAFHLFWILGADLLILGWSGSHCTPHAIRIGQLWSAYSFLCLANLHPRSGGDGRLSSLFVAPPRLCRLFLCFCRLSVS
jgi:hypothetical protein